MSSIKSEENEKEESKSMIIKNKSFPFQKKKINKNFYYEMIYHDENINLKNINEELIIKLELYEKENNELKDVIEKLNQELNYKDKYLEECEKIILELKNNFINDYNKKEIEFKKNEDDIISCSESKKEDEKYKNENNRLKMELNKIKKEYNEAIKKIKTFSLAFDKTSKNNFNYIEMIKEREKKIEENEIKIKNLIEENNSKEEQIHLLTKYKKDENDNNENNIAEIISKNNYMINIFPFEEVFNIDILENKIFNTEKINFKLSQALKDILYIPSKSNKFLTKEYLIDMNFKTELIKSECFSNYIREYNIYQLINNHKFNSRIINEIINKMYFIESNYKKIITENNLYIIENKKLKEKIKEIFLYINKIKEELYIVNTNVKLKINHIITLYEMKLNKIKQKNKDFYIEYINSIYIQSSNKLISFNPKGKNFFNLIKKENERLKNEIAILIRDINDQQNEISNLKKSKHNFQYLNKYLFSVSDYMKYSLIYKLNDNKEILNLFNIMINNTIKNFDDNKNNFVEIIRNFMIVIEKLKTNKKLNYFDDLKTAFDILAQRFNDKFNESNENEDFMLKLVIKLFDIAFFSQF